MKEENRGRPGGGWLEGLGGWQRVRKSRTAFRIYGNPPKSSAFQQLVLCSHGPWATLIPHETVSREATWKCSLLADPRTVSNADS